MNIEYTIDEIEKVGASILKDLRSSVVRFDGPMGAGKTSLIKVLCSQLGVIEAVSSPTFSLVNAYKGKKGIVYHFDFYRLTHAEEALDFGVEEYFDSGALCFLEWADKVADHLPITYDHYIISNLGESRRLIQKHKPL